MRSAAEETTAETPAVEWRVAARPAPTPQTAPPHAMGVYHRDLVLFIATEKSIAYRQRLLLAKLEPRRHMGLATA